MEELKNDIEQIKVQLFTGIKLGRVDKEWGNMIIETCNRALTIHSVVDTLVCDHCDSDNITERQRPEYECNDCKERF